MIIHNDVAQGSEAWLRLRLGVPTASNFHRIVSPTGKLSTSSRAYMFRLIAEQLLNYSLDEDIGDLHWVARGKALEPAAWRMYEFERDAETAPVGFITDDAKRIGCTPDRLIVGQSAAVELKCPSPQVHVAYMVDGFGNDYVPQVQGQLLIGEFDWVDRYSYHEELPPVLVRTHRDEAFIKTLAQALDQFAELKERTLDKVRALGYFGERPKLNGVREDVFGLPPLENPRYP